MQSLARSSIFRVLKNAKRQRTQAFLSNLQTAFFSTDASKSSLKLKIVQNIYNENNDILDKLSQRTLQRQKSKMTSVKSLYYTQKSTFSTVAAANKLTKSQILESVIWEKDANSRLTMRSIESIYNAIIDWSRDEYARLVDTCRTQRRTAKSLQEYIEAINEFDDNYEDIIPQSKREILETLGYDKREFDEAIESFIKEGSPDLHRIQSQLDNKLFDTIPSTKSLEGINVKEIYRGQLEYLEKNRDELMKFAQYPESSADFAVLIWYKLDDYAFEKFGLEDEDFHALWKEKLSVYDDAEVNELLSKRNTFVLKMDEDAELANLKPKQE